MKNVFIRAALLLPILASAAAAQSDPLVTDRPDQTESAITVAPGKVQIEAGGTVETDTAVFGTQRDEIIITAPSVLLRVGLLDRLEARIGGEWVQRSYEVFDPIAPDGTTRVTGSDPFELHLGGKLNLGDDQRSGFASAILGGVNIVTSGDPGLSSAELRASLSQDFTSVFSGGVNLGAEWVDGDGTTTFYTLVVGLGLSETFGTFVELYGDMPWHEGAAQSFDTGLTWQTSEVFQLDLAAGFGLNREAKDALVGLGFSWRIE